MIRGRGDTKNFSFFFKCHNLLARFPNFYKALSPEKIPECVGRSGAKMGSAETSKTAFDQTEKCGVSTCSQGQLCISRCQEPGSGRISCLSSG